MSPKGLRTAPETPVLDAAAERAARRALWRRFGPLSLSDVAMALGTPLQTVALTHLPQPVSTLAGVGLMTAVAVLVESPIIMVLHASTALAPSAAARRAFFRLVLLACVALTAVFAAFCWPPAFRWLFQQVLGAPAPVAALAYPGFVALVPWPAAIAWRRYHQGLLISAGQARAVGLAGLARLGFLAVGLAAGTAARMPGALLAGATMAGGVVVEAAVATAFAHVGGATRPPVEPAERDADRPALPTTLAGVTRFYLPLAGTAVTLWSGRAFLSSVLARAVDASLALAAWPAAWGVVGLVTNATRMVQQVAIAERSGPARARAPVSRLVRWAAEVGLACSGLLAVLALTPWGREALVLFLDGRPALVAATLPVLVLGVACPFAVAILNVYQALYVVEGRTAGVNAANVAGTAVLMGLALALVLARWPGSTAAIVAMTFSLAAETAFLAWRRGKTRGPSDQ